MGAWLPLTIVAALRLGAEPAPQRFVWLVLLFVLQALGGAPESFAQSAALAAQRRSPRLRGKELVRPCLDNIPIQVFCADVATGSLSRLEDGGMDAELGEVIGCRGPAVPLPTMTTRPHKRVT